MELCNLAGNTHVNFPSVCKNWNVKLSNNARMELNWLEEIASSIDVKY